MTKFRAEQAPGSEVVASRLAEVLFIQVLRAHIASGPERNKGWLRAIFDPQMALPYQLDRILFHSDGTGGLKGRGLPNALRNVKGILNHTVWGAAFWNC